MTAHLLSATAAALIALAVAWSLRRQRAGLRHAVLLAALLRFAMPTGWLADAGAAVARHLPATAPPHAMEDLSWLLLTPGTRVAQAAPTHEPGFPVSAGALAWALGAIACLTLWLRRLRRNIPAVREPSVEEMAAFLDARRRMPVNAPVELRIAAADHAPCACGWLRPAVIVPDGLSTELTAAELEAVMAHELAHLRRRDNLSAALARVIVAVFWFHPLVWWIEWRMLAERERACDEMVLGHGARAEDYVGGILKVCRLAFTGPAEYAGAAGSNLKLRMEQIMSATIVRPSSRSLRAALGVLVAAVVLIPVGGGFLRAQPAPEDQSKLIQAAELMRLKRYDDARALLQEILRSDGNSAEALFQMGVLDLSQEKYAKAEESFGRLTVLEPENVRGVMGTVEVYLAQKRVDEAIALLQGRLAKNPKSVEAHVGLGNTAVRAGRYDLAIGEYQQALSIKENGDIYLRLGETYRRKGDLASAIGALERAKTFMPENAIVVNTLALVLDSAGKRHDARQAYEDALKLDPRNGVAMNNLAYLLAQEDGESDKALEYARRAQELLPDMPEVSDTLGWVHMKKGQTDEAIRIFREAIGKQPAHASFHYHLAMALSQKGDRAGALAEARTALENNPTPKEREEIGEFVRATQ